MTNTLKPGHVKNLLTHTVLFMKFKDVITAIELDVEDGVYDNFDIGLYILFHNIKPSIKAMYRCELDRIEVKKINDYSLYLVVGNIVEFIKLVIGLSDNNMPIALANVLNKYPKYVKVLKNINVIFESTARNAVCWNRYKVYILLDVYFKMKSAFAIVSSDLEMDVHDRWFENSEWIRFYVKNT